MGVATPHALGRNILMYAKPEATFGTYVAPAATDAFKILKSSFVAKQERKDRQDSRSTRSRLERITGKKEVSWSLDTQVVPSGAAGTKPDVHDLFKALMGVETTNAGVSVVYTGSALQSALGSLSMVRHVSDVVMEAILGAWVESMTLSVKGGSEPIMTWQGGAADLVTTGCSTTTAQVSAGATSVPVQTADVTNFANGQVIQVGTSTGHTITAGGGTATLTVSPAIVGIQTSGCVVAPYVPTPTTAGSPVAGILGSLTLDAGALPITGAEITTKNNDKAFNDEAFTALVSDYVPGWRDVSGNLTFRARRDHIVHLTKIASYTARAIVMTVGSVAGKKLEVSLPYAEFEFSELQIPEADEGLVTAPFACLGSAGEDEVTFTWK